MGKKNSTLTLAVAFILAAAMPAMAYAATTADSQLSQQINAGVISTSIRDGAGAIVASPSFPMSAVAASTTQQTSTGTFGTSSQRITVDNPSGSTTGGAWTLALNATVPGTTKWTSGGNNYEYNGSAAAGRLTVNPSVGTITAVTGTTTGITLGSQASFTGTTPITLVTASSSAAAIWNGYFTGIGLTQTIPGGQPTGAYALSLTQTVTAQ